MELLQSIPSFLVAIVVLVTVHEFGHFYVARLCGIRVIRFSIGFGKVLWRFYDKHGTEFSLSALPLGGYVKMLDEREGEVPAEWLSQAYTRKTVWQRMAVVLAGPVANFILAILLFWGLLLQGERGLIPVVGTVAEKSIAAKAGLESGQEILEVDGVATPTEQAVERQLLGRLGETGVIHFKVKYPQSNLVYELNAEIDGWLNDAKDPEPLKGLGVELAFPLAPQVGELVANGAAVKAGVQVGDLIVRADDLVIKDWRQWVEYVRARPAKPIHVEVERRNERISLIVKPESFEEKGVFSGRVGIAVTPPSDDLFRQYDYSVAGAFMASLNKTCSTAGFVVLSVKKLILGEISTKNLSGPISIAKVAGSSAQNGVKSFIGFLALLSVFLGVFNLMPVPVLDGGHLVYLTIEVFRGKPVSEKVQMLGYQLGLALVIGLSMMAMYNDIMRL